MPMQTIRLNGQNLDYDVTGSGPQTLVLLSGWCQDHRLFDLVLPHLSDTFRVIRADWRGHGADRTVDADFGAGEQADDVIALLDHLGADRVVPVSTSHGGWANLEIADRLGAERVPRVGVIDWLMLPASPEFLASLRSSGDPDTWRRGRQDLFDIWLAMADCTPVTRHLTEEMAAFDWEMWDRSCRVIDAAYQRWGSPLDRMAALADTRPVAHFYSQPREEAYQSAQKEFAAAHPWFEPHRLGGLTHFPTLESPELLAHQIKAFCA